MEKATRNKTDVGQRDAPNGVDVSKKPIKRRSDRLKRLNDSQKGVKLNRVSGSTSGPSMSSRTVIQSEFDRSIGSQAACLAYLTTAIQNGTHNTEIKKVAIRLLAYYCSNYDAINAELFTQAIKHDNFDILNQLILHYHFKNQQDDLNSIFQPELIELAIKCGSKGCFAKLLAYRPIIDTRGHKISVQQHDNTTHVYTMQGFINQQIFDVSAPDIIADMRRMIVQLNDNEKVLEEDLS